MKICVRERERGEDSREEEIIIIMKEKAIGKTYISIIFIYLRVKYRL
jgi:hypothetical protein